MDVLMVLGFLSILAIVRGRLLFPVWFVAIWYLITCLLFGSILLSNDESVWWETKNAIGQNVSVPVLPEIISMRYKQRNSFEPDRITAEGCAFTVENVRRELELYPFYVVTHFIVGSMTHIIFGLNMCVSLFVAIFWETTERYLFPYYDGSNECWWDQVFFDIFGANSLGILFVHFLKHTQKFKIHWDFKNVFNFQTLLLIIGILATNFGTFVFQFSLFYMGGFTASNGIVFFDTGVLYFFLAYFYDYFIHKNLNLNPITVRMTIVLFTLSFMLRSICMMYYVGLFNNSGWNYPNMEMLFLVCIGVMSIIAVITVFKMIRNRYSSKKLR